MDLCPRTLVRQPCPPGPSIPRGARDIKVGGREAPIRAATVREPMPATESANAPRPRGHPVAALSGSMVYARILAIGGHLGKSPHCYVCLLYTSPSPRDRQKSRMP